MGLPWRARIYLWLMALTAGAGLALWLRAWPPPATLGPAGAVLALVLLLLAAVCQHAPLPLGPRRERDLTIGVYFAGLPLLGAPLAVAVAGGGHLLGQATLALRRDPAGGRRRATPRSLLFNTSQMMVATAAGGLVYYAVQPRALPAIPDDLRGVWALPAAAAVMYAANAGAVAGMAGLQLGHNPLVLWRSGLRVGFLPTAAPFLAGLVVALSAAGTLWGRVAGGLLLVLLLTAVHQALRRAQRLLEAEHQARAEADTARTEMEAARARAESAARHRGEFLQVAAHELRTPLTGLRGYAELLRRSLDGGGPADPAQARRAAAVIDRQSEQLAGLVAQLLDAAGLDADPESGPGGSALDLRPVDLRQLVTTEVAGATARSGRPLRLLSSGPPLWIVADAPRLGRALGAVLDHALKHTPEGETVEVGVGQRPDGGVEVTVLDRGPNLGADGSGRFFEPHYRADDGRHGDGTGLGLYVGRRIVTAHRGALEVESPPRGGARFVLTLPAAGPRPLHPATSGASQGSP